MFGELVFMGSDPNEVQERINNFAKDMNVTLIGGKGEVLDLGHGDMYFVTVTYKEKERNDGNEN